jgi:Reverse transcriptase (RNA-dependent DNA polymerase)
LLIFLSLFSSSTPSSWKHSIVTPIPKVHPPCPLKICDPFQKRLFCREFLKSYLCSFSSTPLSLKHYFRERDQFAFRPAHKTTAALVQLFHNVSDMLQSNEYVRCFLMDFSRAFDTGSHSVLLDKLSKYGCPQVVISWLANFLMDRTQSVVSFSGMSSKLAKTCSIIQGSGIGPTALIAMIAISSLYITLPNFVNMRTILLLLFLVH